MNFRKYQKEDRDQLINLWKIVFPDDPPHNEPSKVIDQKRRIADLIFIAENGNKLVGGCMAGYDGHRGWLYAVAVLPEFRRNNIGQALVKQAMESLKSLGCIKVNLQIRSTNTVVASFYESLGFFPEDRLIMGAFIE